MHTTQASGGQSPSLILFTVTALLAFFAIQAVTQGHEDEVQLLLLTASYDSEILLRAQIQLVATIYFICCSVSSSQISNTSSSSNIESFRTFVSFFHHFTISQISSL